ncbi:hypothetical protein Bca52824_089089 [Brassica carinata]|uniref:Uncharacterized protein n=1 Tax=Brassica carinata TaxID=52824 RepID=A0A8X7PCM4_BRACI|nr:hypothetical protein Bca52824_089089 [Brassica carinata]
MKLSVRFSIHHSYVLSSLSYLLLGNDTTVFWNYPIPVGIHDLGSIRINIEGALHQFGFHGDKDIQVHCKRLKCGLKEELGDAGIFYLLSCTLTYMAVVDKMTTLDMTSELVQFALTAQFEGSHTSPNRSA